MGRGVIFKFGGVTPLSEAADVCVIDEEGCGGCYFWRGY